QTQRANLAWKTVSRLPTHHHQESSRTNASRSIFWCVAISETIAASVPTRNGRWLGIVIECLGLLHSSRI
ncbi:MAG: hypothetical protein WBC13_04820, partial [Dokdonella sp.]